MSNTIGSLVIDLVANTASFSTTLSKAVSDVETGVARIKTAFGGLAEVFTIAGIANLTKSTLDFGDELAKSAIKTGTSAAAISELAFAARQANIDLPELTSSFERMEKTISTLGTGNAAATEAFNALGISFEQISKLSPDQQFEEIANQISKLADPTDKARAAIAIFGKAGAELLPLFEQGAAGIELARQKAIDFGASLDEDQLKKLSDASTAVKDLGESFKNLALHIAAAAGPAIKDILDPLTTGSQLKGLTDRISTLQGLFTLIPGDDPANTQIGNFLQGKILQAQMQIQGLQLAKQIRDSLASGSALTDNLAPGFQPAIEPITVNPNLKIQVSAMAQFYEDLDNATKTGGERLLDDTAKLQAQVQVLLDDGKITLGESFKRLDATSDSQALTDLMTTNAAAIAAAYKQMEDGLKANFADIGADSKLASANMKADFDKTAENAKQSAQSIEDSFATFLVDPFDGGLKKMLAAWVQTLAQMVAKAEAQQIFKALFPDAGGLGSFFQSFLSSGLGGPSGGTPNPGGGGGISEFATGGAFTVGGSGSTDSQLVRFKATPGERVTVTTPGQQASMGGVTVVNHNYIDARTDATQIGQLIADSTQYAIQQSKAGVADMVRRGAFRSP